MESRQNEEIGLAGARVRLFKRDYYSLFLSIYLILIVIESILIAYDPGHYLNLVAQIVILAVSTVCCLANFYWTSTFIDPAGGAYSSKYLYEAFDYYTGIEFAFIVFGWVCLFGLPGIASLRVLRACCYMRYGELLQVDQVPSALKYALHSVHVCARYLDKLALEIFTTRTKGSVVLLGLFFYLAYVFGVAFWVHTKDTAPVEFCGTVDSCVVTMIRLAFYDAKGLDFLSYFSDSDSEVLTALLILYLVVTGIIILNGLIGIFGGMFITTAGSTGKFLCRLACWRVNSDGVCCCYRGSIARPHVDDWAQLYSE